MRELTNVPGSDSALDVFVGQLLGCGAVLSQIISQMARHAAAGGPTPDTVPIPVAAHELLVEVLGDLEPRYERRDLRRAAGLLKEATDRICEEVFFIPPEELARLKAEGELGM
jgi:hypothetical protein